MNGTRTLSALRRLVAPLLALGLPLLGPTAQVVYPDRPDLQEAAEKWRAQLRKDLVETATRAPWIDFMELAYARVTRVRAPKAMIDAHRDARAAADAFYDEPAAARPLLAHPEPKVRVWAAFVLARSLRAEFLPDLGRLCNDSAEFPAVQGLVATFALSQQDPEPPRVMAQQVGEAARSFLSLWEGPAPGTDDFTTWSAHELAHEPSAKRLELEFLLRTGGQSNPRYWNPNDLFLVWRACCLARPGAAEIARIALLHPHVGLMVGAMPSIGSDLEFDARRLGRENLLRLLAGEAPIVDGEALDPVHFETLLQPFRDYVLMRPARLGLLPEDARRLLEIGRETKQLALFHGAARLRPQRATSILRECMDRDTNHWMPAGDPKTACLLWDLQPEQNADFLAEWFHEDPPGGPRLIPCHRHDFLQHLLASYRPVDRALFARLVHDPRFERCTPHSLHWVCLALNRVAFEPPVDPMLFSNFMHPSSLARAFQDLDAAKAAWPEETAEMLRRMAAMREAMRAATLAWKAD